MGLLSAIVAAHPPAKDAGRVGQPDYRCHAGQDGPGPVEREKPYNHFGSGSWLTPRFGLALPTASEGDRGRLLLPS